MSVLVAIVAVILGSCSLVFAQPGTRCPPVAGKPSCVCQPPGEAMIDLTPLSNSDGTPRFPNIGPDPNNLIYSFNPCQNFTLQKGCKNVAICQTYVPYPGITNIPIGIGSSEQIWTDSNGEKYLYYNSGTNYREAFVYLECDHSATEPIITTSGDTDVKLHYKFHLKSCYACPGGCNVAPPSPAVGPTLCPPISGEPPCKCQHPEGIIDLTPLASLNGAARFTGMLTESNHSYVYSYNPCQGFQQGSSWNVHVSRVLVGSHDTTSIAEVGTEAIYYESNGLAHVHYRGPGQIQTRVYLECDQETKNPVINTVNDAHCPLIFEFIVKSCQVCPGGCKEQLKSQLPPRSL